MFFPIYLLSAAGFTVLTTEFVIVGLLPAIARDLAVTIPQAGLLVTLFAFSSENWQRPEMEVKALMSLLGTYLRKEVPQLVERGVSLKFIGRRDNFSDKLKAQLADSEAATAGGSNRVPKRRSVSSQ